MFIVTAKLSKRKLAAILAGVFVLIAACIIIVSAAKNKSADAAALTEEVTVEVSYKKIKDNPARITFLNAFGWEVEENPVSIEEVVIPEDFDETYEKYNELQKSQGLNLEKYQGKTVRRYTYKVTNYQGEESPVLANLLIYKNRVIGGDLCSSEYRGFMHGFMKP